MEYKIINGELYHHGVKGQRWGVRRYQNDDGSLTAAGKKRYENADGSLNEAGKKFYKEYDARRRAERKPSVDADRTKLAYDQLKAENDYNAEQERYKKAHPGKLKSAQKVISGAQDAVDEISKIERDTRPKSNKMKLDLTNMSEEQMRKEINRAMLEKQYNDMFAPEKVNKGRKIATATIAAAGTILALSASAVTIAVGIKELVN